MRDGCMAGVWHDSPCSAAAGLSPDTPKLTALYNEAVELDGRSSLMGWRWTRYRPLCSPRSCCATS
jgi:hypothetical protein